MGNYDFKSRNSGGYDAVEYPALLFIHENNGGHEGGIKRKNLERNSRYDERLRIAVMGVCVDRFKLKNQN